jgi:tetratricopeptide (TPR) repeat protein
VLAAILATTLTIGAGVGADPLSQEQQAATFFHQSATEYELGNFDAALDDIAKAYRLEPRPALLFNLGQCHRALHHWERAAFFYSEYLHKNPAAPNRASVEKLIAEMNAKLEAEVNAAKRVEAAQPIVVEAPPPAPAPEAPPESVTQPFQAPVEHGHGLGIGLLSAGLACGVLTGVAALEITHYNGAYAGAANQNLGGLTYSSTVANAQSSAGTWQVVEIVSGILAIAGVGVAPFVW